MEWKHYKMDDVIDEISRGPFGSDVKKEFYVNKGIPILNGSNLQGFKLQENSFGYLTEEKADSLNKCNAHRRYNSNSSRHVGADSLCTFEF